MAFAIFHASAKRSGATTREADLRLLETGLAGFRLPAEDPA